MLVKYCRLEHNIARGAQTMQLGTLSYYREGDPSFSDPNEGKQLIGVVDYDPAVASDSMQRLIALPARMVDCGIESTFPNCYIFCAAAAGVTRIEAGGCAHYESSYQIADVSWFAASLAQLLQRSLLLSDFEPSQGVDRFGLSELGEIRVMCLHRGVRYAASKADIMVSSALTVDPDTHDPVLRQVFTKDKQFQQQQEYRFAFLVQHAGGGGLLAVKKDPKVLRLNSLERFIRPDDGR